MSFHHLGVLDFKNGDEVNMYYYSSKPVTIDPYAHLNFADFKNMMEDMCLQMMNQQRSREEVGIAVQNFHRNQEIKTQLFSDIQEKIIAHKATLGGNEKRDNAIKALEEAIKPDNNFSLMQVMGCICDQVRIIDDKFVDSNLTKALKLILADKTKNYAIQGWPQIINAANDMRNKASIQVNPEPAQQLMKNLLDALVSQAERMKAKEKAKINPAKLNFSILLLGTIETLFNDQKKPSDEKQRELIAATERGIAGIGITDGGGEFLKQFKEIIEPARKQLTATAPQQAKPPLPSGTAAVASKIGFTATMAQKSGEAKKDQKQAASGPAPGGSGATPPTKGM